MISELTASRFWAKVDRKTDAECWLWLGARTPAGYGKQAIQRRARYAHHLALEMSGRPRPEGAITLHSCDNPSCVNPSHLSWGTQKQNMRQAIDRGRAPHTGRAAGSRNGNAKLTEADVRRIRSETGSHIDIARRYGVSRSLIGAIRTGVAWQHV